MLRNCYCVCDHFVFIGKERIKWHVNKRKIGVENDAVVIHGVKADEYKHFSKVQEKVKKKTTSIVSKRHYIDKITFWN